MSRNCFLDFAVEHWFGCRATEPGFTEDIGAMEVWLIDWGPRRGREGRQYEARQGQDCGNCGYKHEKGKEYCPAQHSKCRSCQRIGHYARKCRGMGNATNSTSNVEQVTADTRDCQDSGIPVHLGSVLGADIARYDAEEPWRITLQLRGGEVTFKIDSGADVSIMTEADWKQLHPWPNLKTTDVKLTSPGGPLTSKGHFIARVEHSRQVYNFWVIVTGAESVTENLLSRRAATSMGLIKCIDSTTATDLFGEIGLVKCDPVNIVLKGDTEPYCVTAARTVPVSLQHDVKTEL